MVTNVHPLLDAPRGREFLLNCAIESSIRAVHGDSSPLPPEEASELHSACYYAAVIIDKEGYLLEENLDDIATSFSLFLESEHPITSDHALTALKATVDDARYWESPSSHQFIAHHDRLSEQLSGVADNLERNGALLGWNGTLNINRQYLIIEDGATATNIDIHRELEISSQELRRGESRWRKPTGGEWWSTPPATAPSTSADEWNRDRPALLDFKEDMVIYPALQTAQVNIAPNVRVFEIAEASDWLELCQRFPLEATRQRNITWAEAFDKHDRWIIPDWSQVSNNYDAVHLSPFGYLLLSGGVLRLPGDIAGQDDAATVLAGWSPGETIWLNNSLTLNENKKNWYFNEEAYS